MDEIHCKGRNGWFSFGQTNVFGAEDEAAWIEVFSTRIGREAPIIFRGNPNDLIEVFSDVLEKLKKITTQETGLVQQAKICVNAVSDVLHEIDENVPGTYEITLDSPVQRGEAAEAALDKFHITVPIKVLEDFNIEVFDQQGKTLA